MAEAKVLALLAQARDAARADGLPNLAEQLDDAVLAAASAYHDARVGRSGQDHDGEGSGAVRELFELRIH